MTSQYKVCHENQSERQKNKKTKVGSNKKTANVCSFQL